MFFNMLIVRAIRRWFVVPAILPRGLCAGGVDTITHFHISMAKVFLSHAPLGNPIAGDPDIAPQIGVTGSGAPADNAPICAMFAGLPDLVAQVCMAFAGLPDGMFPGCAHISGAPDFTNQKCGGF